MFISPILLPKVKVIDFTRMAIVTDLTQNLNLISIMVSLILCILIVYSIFKNFKLSIMKCLLTYIIWNIVLHIVIGFGLHDYMYDMYLYAGHYISVIFMIIGLSFSNIKSSLFKTIMSLIQIVIIVFIAYNNIPGIFNLLDFLIKIYK